VFCAALLAITAIAAAKPGGHRGGGHHHGGHHHGGNQGGASRSSTLLTGFQEADFLTDNADLRTQVFDKAAQAHAGIARFNVSWREMTTGQPVDPTSPSDPAYHFARLDAAVQDATARGIQPLIMIDHAPAYALGANPDPTVPSGTWKPDPNAVGQFATAVAQRYSGSFAGLPRVTYFQVWNEPNLAGYLTPVRDAAGTLVSPGLYRDMVNAFYAAIKSVHADNIVVTGGTAPYGDSSGNIRSRPLDFLRTMLCLRPDLSGPTCNTPTNFDVLAHHPINTAGGPDEGAHNPDDASTADFKRVRQVLRAAERVGTAPGGPHPLWATEVWWESNPPDGFRGQSLDTQAQYIEQALYVLWKQGASAVLNFEIRDEPYDPEHPLATIQSGIYLRDWTPKPSAQAFAFPFVTERRSKTKVFAWGKSPEAGTLRIERSAGGKWRKVDKLPVQAGEMFTDKLQLKRKVKLRARVNEQTSLTWRQRG
jgi:hypothetical protein